MNENKKKFIRLLYLWGALAVIHFLGVFVESKFKLEGISLYFTLPVQIFGIYMAWHILSYRCPNPICRRSQILRFTIPPQVFWPEPTCYHCGTPLNARYKDGKPIEP